MYFNCHRESAQAKIAVRSWIGLLPALLGIAAEERIQQVIEKNLLAAEHFFRPAGMSSLACSEPLYNNAKRGLYGRIVVSNWQGPVWVMPNVLAVRCLNRYGYSDKARELSWRVVNTLAQGLESHGCLFENYDSETSEPLWAPKFLGWNVLALELLELLD